MRTKKVQIAWTGFGFYRDWNLIELWKTNLETDAKKSLVAKNLPNDKDLQFLPNGQAILQTHELIIFTMIGSKLWISINGLFLCQ